MGSMENSNNSNNSNKRGLIIGFWVVIILIVGALVWKYHASAPTPAPANTNETATSTTATTTDSGVTSSMPNITVTEPKPQKVNVPEPNLTVPTSNPSAVDTTVFASIQAKMNITVANLKKNSTSFQDWVDLGFERKTLNDYAGAAEDWEYVSLLYPENTIAFGDLGDLYANFLHVNSKAITNFETAIKNNPQDVNSYTSLATLYQSMNDPKDAEQTLQAGITANPNDLSLYVSMARFEATNSNDSNHITNARYWYDKAIALAKSQKNTDAATQLGNEEAQVK